MKVFVPDLLESKNFLFLNFAKAQVIFLATDQVYEIRQNILDFFVITFELLINACQKH